MFYQGWKSIRCEYGKIFCPQLVDTNWAVWQASNNVAGWLTDWLRKTSSRDAFASKNSLLYIWFKNNHHIELRMGLLDLLGTTGAGVCPSSSGWSGRRRRWRRRRRRRRSWPTSWRPGSAWRGMKPPELSKVGGLDNKTTKKLSWQSELISLTSNL